MAEYDFSPGHNYDYIDSITGQPHSPGVSLNFSTAGVQGSSCFAAAINLETSSGMEISGLNASQMSDIQFNATWGAGQVTGHDNTPSLIQAFVYYDAMLLLKAANVVEMFN